MKEHHVRVSHAPENLAREEQLAWKLARVAVDAAPLDPETSEMIINRVLDNAGVAIAASSPSCRQRSRAGPLQSQSRWSDRLRHAADPSRVLRVGGLCQRHGG